MESHQYLRHNRRCGNCIINCLIKICVKILRLKLIALRVVLGGGGGGEGGGWIKREEARCGKGPTVD